MEPVARFGCIREIHPEDDKSWRDRIFLTVDIDWASDDVIAECVDLIEDAGVSATWFITHDTPQLERLRANHLFEIGIHPNFNFLLDGDDRNGGNAEEVLARVLELVPDARAVRSHSMTQSSVLLNLFSRHGLTHDCNHFVPNEVPIELKPWRIWNDMIKVPYFWEDDVHHLCSDPPEMAELAGRPGLRVFDFHPIHVFLNSESTARYDEARPFLGDTPALRARRSRSGCGGSRDLLIQLLECR